MRSHRLNEYVAYAGDQFLYLAVVPAVTGVVAVGFMDWFDPSASVDSKVSVAISIGSGDA